MSFFSGLISSITGEAGRILDRHDQASTLKVAPKVDEKAIRKSYTQEKAESLFRKFQEEGVSTRLHHVKGIVSYVDGESSFKDDWATRVHYSEKFSRPIDPIHYEISEYSSGDSSSGEESVRAIVDIFFKDGFVFLSFMGKSGNGESVRKEINYDII